MAAAAYIGRVSVLAIALGAGAAIAGGTAHAESPNAGQSPAGRAATHDAGPRAITSRTHTAAPGGGSARRGHTPRAAAVARPAGPQASAQAVANADTGILGGLASLFANQTPSVRPVQSPQQGAGVITGDIGGADADSAPLTYSITQAPAHGTVSLAGSAYTYTPDASVAYTGTTDSFRVTVSDAATGFHLHGIGGLVNLLTFGLIGDPGHTVTTGISLTVAPFDVPTEELSTFCGCTLMPAGTVFHADITNLAVLPQSGTWTALLGGNLRAAWGGDPWMNVTGGMPVNVAPASLAKETVIFNRGLSTSGPTIDDRPYAIPDRPIVEGMPNFPAWDRHLLVLQEGSCVSQELYNVANGVELPAISIGDALANAVYAAQYGSAWIAEAGVQFNMSSPLYPVKGEANASQLPYLPLILRPDELQRGSIDHMLGITIAKDRGTGFTWPARSGDGTGTNPDGVPMGTVLRLRPDFPITGYDPATQVVLRALQQHGAVIYDSTNPGQDGATLLAMSNGWTGTSYLIAQRELSTIPLSAFDAVDVLSLAVDPGAGWVIGT